MDCDKNGEIESITKIVNEIKIEILTLNNEKDPSGNKKDLIQFFLFLIEPVNVFWYPPYINQIFIQVRNASIKIVIVDKILNLHAFSISFF